MHFLGRQDKLISICVSTLAITSFVMMLSSVLPVYASPDLVDCLDSSGQATLCGLDVDSTVPLVDHGVFLTVTDQAAYVRSMASTPPTPVSIQFSGTGVTTQMVDLYPNISIQNKFTGYVYFKNSDNDPVLQPIVKLPNFVQPKPHAIALQAAYTPQTGSINSIQTLSVKTAYYDNTGKTWDATYGYKPYPSASQLPNPTYKQSCPPGDMGWDGICGTWKIPANPTTGGLKIPFVSGTGYYFYQCDINARPFPGTLVGSSTIDPQCPTATSNDIYVEVDAIDKQMPDPSVLQNVITAFAAQNITLHIQLDETIPMHRHEIGSDISGGSGLSQADSIKKWYGGTAGERACTANIGGVASCAGFTGYQPLLTAKKQVFHYALFISAQLGNTRSGYSEQGGNDLMISLGTFTGGVGSVDEIAGTFMHELGHNLNLQHGGSDANNCKPIYDSVMNYEYQDTSVVSDRHLDYSHGAFSMFNLDETNLVETRGIPLNQNAPSTNYYPTLAYGYVTQAGIHNIQTAPANSPSIEWDHPDTGETPSATPIQSNISDMHTKRITSDCTDPNGPLTSISDNNDWTGPNSMIGNFKSWSSFTDTYKILVPSSTNRTYFNLEQNGVGLDTPSPWMIDFIKHYNDADHLNNVTDFLQKTQPMYNSAKNSMTKDLHAKMHKHYSLKTYELPIELPLDDIPLHHSMLITSIQSHVSYLNSTLFDGGDATKTDMLSTLANAEGSVYDYGKTTNLLYGAGTQAQSIIDDDARNTILKQIHDLVLIHQQANSVNRSQYPNVMGVPNSDAGSNTTVTSGHRVSLNGINSSGGNLVYSWQQVSGEPVTLALSNAPSPSFFVPAMPKPNNSTRTFVFELTVGNSFGHDASIVTIKAMP